MAYLRCIVDFSIMDEACKLPFALAFIVVIMMTVFVDIGNFISAACPQGLMGVFVAFCCSFLSEKEK